MEKHILDSAYISLALNSSVEPNVDLRQPLTERKYWDLRSQASSTMALQLGITAVTHLKNQVRLDPFNIPLFLQKDPHMQTFDLAVSQVKKLAKLDFNSLFYDGVPFTTLLSYSHVLEATGKKSTGSDADTPEPVHVIYANQKFKEISKWLARTTNRSMDDPENSYEIDIEGVKKGSWSFLVQSLPTIFPKCVLEAEVEKDELGMEQTLVLRRSTKERLEAKKERERKTHERENMVSFFRGRRVCKDSESRVVELLQEIAASSGKPRLADPVVKQVRLLYQKPELAAPDNKDHELIAGLVGQDSDLLSDPVGATRAVAMIMRHRKPVVINSGIYGLMVLYRNFVAPLPPSLEIFKSQIAGCFEGGVYQGNKPHRRRESILSDPAHLDEALKEAEVEAAATEEEPTRLSGKYNIPTKFRNYHLNATESKLYHSEAGYQSLVQAIQFDQNWFQNKEDPAELFRAEGRRWSVFGDNTATELAVEILLAKNSRPAELFSPRKVERRIQAHVRTHSRSTEAAVLPYGEKTLVMLLGEKNKSVERMKKRLKEADLGVELEEYGYDKFEDEVRAEESKTLERVKRAATEASKVQTLNEKIASASKVASTSNNNGKK